MVETWLKKVMVEKKMVEKKKLESVNEATTA
jgi:hypothetical protein